ncbi:uncharacterized protein METZ01_LOCUS412653, partial [marine metagenome]
MISVERMIYYLYHESSIYGMSRSDPGP